MKTEQKQNVEKEYWPIDDSMVESIESLPKSYRPARREFEELIYEIKDRLEKRLIEAGHSKETVYKIMYESEWDNDDNFVDVFVVPEMISLMSIHECGIENIVIEEIVENYFDDLDSALENQKNQFERNS